MKSSSTKTGDSQTTLFVEGMHCAACEILIKQTLEGIDGITSVKASTSSSKVTITHDKGLKPDLNILNETLSEHGYILSHKDPSRSEKPLFYKEKGSLLYNPNKLFHYSVNLVIISFLVVAFLLITKSGLASRVMVTSEAGPLVYFLFGLVAGASTCAALVGGVILSLSKKWNTQYASSQNKLGSLIPHGMFHIGRLLSFAVAGGFLALLGASITSTVSALAPFITTLVAVIMVILGLQMLNIAWAKRVVLALPGGLGRKMAKSSEHSQGTLSPFYIGAASLLLPCGMTLTAFVTSIASGNFIQGALSMFMFALGSMIALSFISFASVGFGTQKTWSGRFNMIAGVMVIFFALFTFNSQLNALGLPSMTDVAVLLDNSGKLPSGVIVQEDVQVIRMEASAYGYEPTAFTVQSGMPVRWEINDTGASGCTNAIIARDFFSGQFPLNPGMNVIEFTPTTPGTYKFSCWMGMVSGVIKVI